VLLISLKCGSMGLNITEASQVFILDPWYPTVDYRWNEAIEQQAIDRIFRIGQCKNVKVFRFVMKDTVEDRVLAIQAEKTLLIRDALSGIKGASAKAMKEARKEEIIRLFGINLTPQ
jgi:SNF2 family DNA or RNA helicase